MTTAVTSSTPGLSTTLPYAVVGATGQQGGAVARALLAAGATVRALTRDPSGDAARALGEQGAETVRADVGDLDSLVTAFTDVAGVFAMTTPDGADGVEGEVRDGRAVAEAARRAAVPRVVFSSVGGAERDSGVPHFDSKRQVEEHMLDLGLPVTILRPVFFMENLAFLGPQEDDGGGLVVRMPLPGGVPLQMIAVDDVGAVALAALRDPGAVPGGAVEIAGDEVTGEQVAAAYAAHTGREVRYEPLPVDALGDDADMRAMWSWFAETDAYRADLELTRRLDPGVQDLATWIARHA